MSDSQPRPWQRQPDESAADFNAFVGYLRLKGRRSQRLVAAQTGRSPAALRRLSARFNWPARVRAFEERLAEAKQEAVDSVIQTGGMIEKSRLEQLRLDEFELAQEVLHASGRWLALATNPRRRLVPLAQVARLIELATRLGRLAAGMPTGDEQTRSHDEPPGYWTQSAVEEALAKIYGSDPVDSPVAERPPAAVTAPTTPLPDPGPTPSAKPGPPPDEKRDLTPYAMVVGAHGFRCLQPINPK